MRSSGPPRDGAVTFQPPPIKTPAIRPAGTPVRLRSPPLHPHSAGPFHPPAHRSPANKTHYQSRSGLRFSSPHGLPDSAAFSPMLLAGFPAPPNRANLNGHRIPCEIFAFVSITYFPGRATPPSRLRDCCRARPGTGATRSLKSESLIGEAGPLAGPVSCETNPIPKSDSPWKRVGLGAKGDLSGFGSKPSPACPASSPHAPGRASRRCPG